jgi:hypothetical protein
VSGLQLNATPLLVLLALALSACGRSRGSEAPAASSSGAVILATGAGACRPACAPGSTCCEGKCVDLSTDRLNCGACSARCEEPTPYCKAKCIAQPCQTTCDAGTCCGANCCSSGKICCVSDTTHPQCVEPKNGTCPPSCGINCQ